MIKQDIHVIKGMQKDISVSKFNSEFVFDAQNIRITAKEDNTLMSVTNEKGTKEVVLKDSNNKAITISGVVIGYCILNEYLILFTTNNQIDRIYRLEAKKDYFEVKVLVESNLDFDFRYPIESLGIYENENIQKVYWVDGKNQPRVINIVKDKLYNNFVYDRYSFDFVQELNLNEEVEIERIESGNGNFSSGTIQYAFTYYNKYGQESNIFNISELNYISYTNRGGSPENKISNSFNIVLKNLDKRFEFIRIYSIHRTSIDATPSVRRVIDLTVQEEINYVDTGNDGETVDPTQLLYIGGESIIANTITSKDNTLFLGNIKLVRPSIPKELQDKIRVNTQNNIKCGYKTKVFDVNFNDSYYVYNNQMFKGNTSTFKVGEHYRLGVQFQYKDGKWSEPVFLQDYVIPDNVRPTITNNILSVVSPYFKLDNKIIRELTILGFKKARALVVFPSINDRKIVVQGMLCPTVFRAGSRKNNTPFSQSSWFIRPNLTDARSNNRTGVEFGANVEFRHLHALRSGKDRGAEIQNILESPDFVAVNSSMTVEDNEKYSDIFFVDQSVITMHSPDIEFDNSFHFLESENLKLRIVGLINFTSSIGDIDIQTSSPTINVSDSTGFLHKTLGVKNKSINAGRSLVSGLFYKDYLVDEDGDGEKYEAFTGQDYEFSFLIYPWHRSGSLNNDTIRPEGRGTRSAVLKQKKISNLKFSDYNTWLDASRYWKAYEKGNPLKPGITQVQLFNSDEVSLVKIPVPANSTTPTMNYYGNVDTLLPTAEKYGVIFTTGNRNGDKSEFSDSSFTTPEEYSSGIGKEDESLRFTKDPVRMKYKSSPHLVFALNHEAIVNSQVILPSVNNLHRVDSSLYLTGLYWSKNTMTVVQDNINTTSNYPYLFLAELYREDEDIKNPFGEVESCQWLPAGKSIHLGTENRIDYTYGDTWYQRYDCLKTYPFTQEDENQVVEIASFMCETRTNIDGRYDRNRGQVSNLNMSPRNFNLLNPVYSQKDNFFSYKLLDKDYYKLNSFPNTITWTKEKSLAELVDTWTNITMASTLDLDGDKGKIVSLNTLNNEIFCFQKLGISNILFNSRVQIPASDGVPIEITNGLKVQGKRYISNTLGCNNKWSIVTTPSGLYFIDNTTDGIYLFNGQQVVSLSDNLSMGNWVGENNSFDDWNPVNFNNFVSYYDSNGGDVYFVNKNTALVYSELLGQFTSFMSYENVPAMFNVNNKFYSFKNNKLWEHFAGDYNMFYGKFKPYSFTVISNADSPYDKIFNNIEYRADSWYKDNVLAYNNTFDTLEVWNEYQKGICDLTYLKSKPSPLKKKFRVWRANIPRCNVDWNGVKANKLDRIRNTWAYIKLSRNKENTDKMVFHDLMVNYFL